MRLWRHLGLPPHSIIALAELLEDPSIIDLNAQNKLHSDIFRRAIDKQLSRRLVELGYQGVLTPKDVSDSLARLVEIPFKTQHKIGAILKK